MSLENYCWSCKKLITDEQNMLTDGPFEGNQKHYYCSADCWMRGQ